MKSVQRHSITVRLTHWAIALSGILLLFSGFGQMPMYKRYNIVKIPGLAWSSDYEITLLLHYLGAVLFTAAIFFHLVYHLRRREYAILVRRGDFKEAIQGFMAMVGVGKEPAHGKFQAKQRMIYLIIGLTSLTLVVTGLIKCYKNLGAIVVDPLLLQWSAFIHTGTGMFFMVLFFAHLAAFALKAHWPMVPSMFTGRIDKEFAEKHHPKWQID